MELIWRFGWVGLEVGDLGSFALGLCGDRVIVCVLTLGFGLVFGLGFGSGLDVDEWWE
jgi:hypothetical protein